MKKPRYKMLVDHFSSQIRTGKLTPGTRLPTHRELAKMHQISLVTASRIYAELEAMGLTRGETGRGTFVREISLPPGLGIEQQLFSEMVDLNFNYPALPTQTELLRQALKQLSSAGDLESLLRYQPHIGRIHERALIAKHLQLRGLDCDAEEVVLTSGAQHGLTIAAMVLLKPGDIVAVDAVTYPGFKILADLYHFELLPIPTSEDGMDLDKLAEFAKDHQIHAVYTMPTLHNPMGYVMDMQARERLVALAKQYQFWLIEDGAYAFLIENAPKPLAALLPEQTLYISGFSKSVATGLRIGFMLAPKNKISAIERIIRCTTWNTPAILTRIVCQWLEDGVVTQIEAEKREDARSRQDLAKKVLSDFSTISHPSSYFIWIQLPEEVRAEAVTKRLLDHQISVSTATPFAVGNIIPHAIRLALGSVEMPALEAALKEVKSVIEYYTDW